MTRARRLILASGNAHKVEELAAMLSRAEARSVRELEVVGMKVLGAPPEIDESETDFHGNAVLKARGIARWAASRGAAADDLVLSDDSGICIDALDGRPGVFSARYAGPDADDAANNRRMVEELRALGLDASRAHYACVLCLVRVDGASIGLPSCADADWVAHALGGDAETGDAPSLCVEGRCEGEVRTVAQGSGGFGYDPHFWVDGRERTFAELSEAAKAARSHRGAAMDRLMAGLPEILSVLGA